MTTFRFRWLPVIAVFLAQPVVAQDSGGVRADRILSASALQSRCEALEQNEADRLDIAYCLGAISGVSDAASTLIAFFKKGQAICLGATDSIDSMRLAFLSHMKRHPEDRDLPAATVLISILTSQYGCNGAVK